METQNQTVLDTILGVFSGENKPEVLLTANVSLDNATILKIVAWGALLIIGAIALSQWLLRITLRRFFGKS